MTLIKVGVVGARVRNTTQDKNLIRNVLKRRIGKGDTLHLVSGGCPKGADRFAEELSQELKLSISIHYPNKEDMKDDSRYEYARVCYERNTKIAEECDILLALPAYNDIGLPIGGTANTMKKTEELGKPVVVL
jgi:hypothetical protein